jgi:hypothetical protein
MKEKEEKREKNRGKGVFYNKGKKKKSPFKINAE